MTRIGNGLRSASDPDHAPSGNEAGSTRVGGLSEEGPQGARAAEVRLRVLATSDLHANLLSYDYALNQPMFGQGLAQAASLIASARAESPQSILLDNGDFLQGNALSDMASERRSARVHPVISAMNALGYDAAALGNHEFNFGLGLLDRAIADARFPIVSANVVARRGAVPEKDTTYVRPFTVIERRLPDQNGESHLLRIGVIGLTPAEILQWDNRHLNGRLDVRPMEESARAWIPVLRKAGADLVICLAHTGIPQALAFEDGCQAANLARIAGIDALVTGHSHRVFPLREPSPDPEISPQEGTVCGKPVVQPGFNGSHLGVMDLRLQKTGEGWRVAAARSQAISVSEVVAGLSPLQIRKSADVLRKAVLPDHRAALAWARRPLGRSTVAMSTFFAQVAWVPAMALLAASKTAYVRTRVTGLADQSLPLLAAVAAYRTGGRGGVLNYSQMRAGDVSMRHVLDLLPFPNTLVVHRITGAEIREMLERSAAAFRQIIPRQQDQPLIDPAFPNFAFTAISGLSYRFDLTQPSRYTINGKLADPACCRVMDLTRDGKPVTDDMRFLLVSNSYRTGGARDLPKPLAEDIVLNDNTLCSKAFKEYLQSIGTITPEKMAIILGTETWAFKPVSGTSVTLDTGTAAEDHLDEAAHLRPQFMGLTESGFRRYRLHL